MTIPAMAPPDMPLEDEFAPPVAPLLLPCAFAVLVFDGLLAPDRPPPLAVELLEELDVGDSVEKTLGVDEGNAVVIVALGKAANSAACAWDGETPAFGFGT